MSLIGAGCVLIVAGGTQTRVGVFRAASQPIQRSSDFSKTQVLIEYSDTPGCREWINLSCYQAVYVEDQLVWARRILASENNRSVAWPAKAYLLLCGSSTHSSNTFLVEYFCDKERAYLQISDTKELRLSEARNTLSQHTEMLHELSEWETSQQNRDMLLSGSLDLTGTKVNVCDVRQQHGWITGTVSYHNLLSKELMVRDDVGGRMNTVNPLVVQVVPTSSSMWPQQQSQQMTNNGLYSTPSIAGSQGSISSPIHSPQLRHPPHPSFYNSRRSSLQTINPALMRSEPNLHGLSSSGTAQPFTHPTGSYHTPLGSPPNTLPPPSFPLSDYLSRSERSKSLSNIHQFSLPQGGKRRSSHAVPLQSKRTRFNMPPMLQEEDDEDDDFPPNRQLSRCASQPVLFSRPGSRVLSHQEVEEDDLDLIHSIISREQSLDNVADLHSKMRSQSLSRIPQDLGRSMPSLHQVGSMHILHENYTSNPDFTTLGSPPAYHQPGHDSLSTHRLSGDIGVVSGYEQHVEMVADSSSHIAIHPDLSHPNSLFSVDLQTNGNPSSEIKQDLSFSHQHADSLLSPIDLSGPSCLHDELDYPRKPLHVAGSPQMLSGPATTTEYNNEQNSDSEMSIDKVVNQHMADGGTATATSSTTGSSTGHKHTKSSSVPAMGEKTRVGNREVHTLVVGNNHSKRGRGRPRLTEEEKMRRRELRDMGLMKRSKRRTKEEVAQWRAERIRSPAKRGRKPGTGKKNMVKGVTGKVILVKVDLSRFENNTVLYQNGFCQAYNGVSRCLECSTVTSGDFPISRYCRFLEFRKLRIVNNTEGLVKVEGFSSSNDAKTEDLVPWTPLRAGYSGVDQDSAVYLLSRIMKHFISIIADEAHCIPNGDVVPLWKCAVKGVRELCDTCETTLFNLHWTCQHCGFCICPNCYQLSLVTHDSSEVGSSSCAAPWPTCTINNQPHSPFSLILTQIIPGNTLSEVLCQALQLCNTHNIPVSPPPVVAKLVGILSRQVASSSASCSSSPTDTARSSLPYLSPPVVKTLAIPSLELPHSCSNGSEEEMSHIPIDAPHLSLCAGDILCLLDPSHPGNVAAFQASWQRGRPVMIAGVDKRLNKELWTPGSFLRDFGDELADLVDCYTGLMMTQVPSSAFWSGFENLDYRLKDPATDEPRLLKLKDWPTREDFSDKLPDRFTDLMDALPLPDYTQREGKLNLAASLPKFFVKPDLGPKMYNAYGTAVYPDYGTTNLHLDMSDAVNVMVYAADPKTFNESDEDMYRLLQSECCRHTVNRIRTTSIRPGALWHIYSRSDASKIRHFLRKVFEERGMNSTHPGTDPIHDQLVYLDADLRERLLEEEGVQGWCIAQCVGDAIFIPAGAPHQVQNISSCIKVAEDFVSPEHVGECLTLTEEFRQLSDNHANHEDKLQIKNIVYHSVKDIVGVLRQSK